MAKKSGDYYISKAERAGCTVKNGRGDHVKVYAPDNSSMMTIPKNLRGNGTEYAIVKWLATIGALLIIIGIVGAFCL